MLFSTFPTANVLDSIRPLKSALTVLFTIFKVAFILPPIIPCFYTSSFHVGNSEFSLVVLIEVSKVVPAKALKMPVYEISLVVASIFPLELALSILFAFIKASDVVGLLTNGVSPGFYSFTMLLILKPISFILGIIGVNEDSIAIGLVIFPVTLVEITIRMGHPSLPVGLVSSPHSLIFRTIRPELYAYSVTLPSFLVPLSLIQLPIAHILVLIYVDSLHSVLHVHFLIRERELAQSPLSVY